MRTNKIFLMSVFLTIIFLFFFFDLQKYLTLEFFKSSKTIFNSIQENNSSLFLLVFIVIYILVTTFSLPGATLLTLAGGVFFGLILGTIVVSFSSTIGATFAMLISRYFIKDFVQNRFSKHMKNINHRMKKDGVFYLLTLRLVPMVPFFLVNLLMGVTKIRILTFFWVSQLGMLPATFLYINAGSKLDDIRSMSDVLSPIFISSFLILGLFPFLVKKILSFIYSEKFLVK